MNKQIRYILASLVVIAAGTTVFRDALANVMQAVAGREDSSHGIFVPIFSIYFLWTKRDRLSKLDSEFDYFGLVGMMIILGVAFLNKSGAFQIQYIIFILLVLSAIYAIHGRKVCGFWSFPLLFFLTATPIPDEAYLAIANVSRAIALSISLKIISLLNIPYFRDEWFVHLPTGLLIVNVSCSGIRYLISFFVFSLAYSYLFKSSIMQRIAIPLLSFPVSILASTLRLTAIFTLSYYVDPRLADQTPHIMISWIIFFIVMATLIIFDLKIVNRISATKSQIIET